MSSNLNTINTTQTNTDAWAGRLEPSLIRCRWSGNITHESMRAVSCTCSTLVMVWARWERETRGCGERKYCREYFNVWCVLQQSSARNVVVDPESRTVSRTMIQYFCRPIRSNKFNKHITLGITHIWAEHWIGKCPSHGLAGQYCCPSLFRRQTQILRISDSQ